MFDLDLYSEAAQDRAKKMLRADLTAGDIPREGHPSAKVLLSLFSDFQCPFCREEQVILDQALVKYKDTIVILFHNLVVPSHDWAGTAAEVMSCIHQQDAGAFWTMSEWLFANQSQVSRENNVADRLISEARKMANVDTDLLGACVSNHGAEVTINHDAVLAKDLSVTDTPTIFVEGRRFVGAVNITRLQQAIDEEMIRRSGSGQAGGSRGGTDDEKEQPDYEIK